MRALPAAGDVEPIPPPGLGVVVVGRRPLDALAAFELRRLYPLIRQLAVLGRAGQVDRGRGGAS